MGDVTSQRSFLSISPMLFKTFNKFNVPFMNFQWTLRTLYNFAFYFGDIYVPFRLQALDYGQYRLKKNMGGTSMFFLEYKHQMLDNMDEGNIGATSMFFLDYKHWK